MCPIHGPTNPSGTTRTKEIGRIGYEINFDRFFYKYVPPRTLKEIDAELKQVEKDIAELQGEVTE